MRKFLMVALAGVLLPMSAHAVCALQAEADAMNLRALKSSLMVGALSCNQQSSYNTSISKNQGMFSNDGGTVKAYFSRAYGGNAEYQLNRFVTKLANDASQISMKQDSEAYCSAVKKTFKKVIALDKAGVSKFASGSHYASLHGIQNCGGGKEASVAMNSRRSGAK